MITTLEQNVSLHWVSCFAELCTLESRPDLQLLCRWIASDGLRSNLPEAALANLRRNCVHLGLLSTSGELTAQGAQCSRTAEVMLPEQGLYSFLLASHQAFGTLLLHMKRERSQFQDTETKNLRPVTETLKPSIGMKYTSVFEPKLHFQVKSLPGQQIAMGRIQTASGACRIHWNLDLKTGTNTRHLDGSIANGDKDERFSLGLEPLPEEDVRRLISRWDRRWNKQHGFLGINDDQKDTFVRSLRVVTAEIPGQGSFENVQLNNVPVGPANEAAAQQWSMRLLSNQLRRAAEYITQNTLQTNFESLTSGSPLGVFSLPVPTIDEVQKHLTQSRLEGALYTWWRLAAPVDLGVTL